MDNLWAFVFVLGGLASGQGHLFGRNLQADCPSEGMIIVPGQQNCVCDRIGGYAGIDTCTFCVQTPGSVPNIEGT